MNKKFQIPYYEDYVSPQLRDYLMPLAQNVAGVKDLKQIGKNSGLESTEALQFICDLYDQVETKLAYTLSQRTLDRKFIDERTKSYHQFNSDFLIPFTSDEYQTVMGDSDADKRIVFGPLRKNFFQADETKKVAPVPTYLQGNHITLFGPPDSAKLAINAMNAYHRQLPNEPAVVKKLVGEFKGVPMWGADDEDSKTPMRKDLVEASVNLKGCFHGDLTLLDEKRGKEYKINPERKSFPIKRFPGLALPASFVWYKNNPLPLHLYDFAIHLYEHWDNPEALVFYVPKLENEEEAAYIKFMFETAEKLIQQKHPTYKLGTIRCIIVLENPRAVFRLNEMIDELYPYFVGASLGWHDFLGSTARLFKEDANYRIPVKADPDIVIKYIKASHELVTEVVGKRGGIRIGGMYGILPMANELESDSFQITLRGFFKDVITQMKRGLTGYWVAHPDFVRIGIAIVQAWKHYANGDEKYLKDLISGLLNQKYTEQIWDFIKKPDIEGLDVNDSLYPRSLIVADINESDFIANNDPEEIRYNVFQSLQYLTDWLSGNGCVALPASVEGIPVRVMDDLATAERSRWEVWHELYHGRFKIEDFIRIAHEEMNFIRRDYSDDKKIVQVKYTEQNAKWYQVAFKLMLKLMTDEKPVEFATELLIPFTLEAIRAKDDPWSELAKVNPEKYCLSSYVERYNYYFEMCGCDRFALEHAKNLYTDTEGIQQTIMSFSKQEIIQAASFHGNIGQTAKSLDAMAKQEQQLVSNEAENIKSDLLKYGEDYLTKFGMKFLISAQGKNAAEILANIQSRMENSLEVEEKNAKLALAEITLKRVHLHPLNTLKNEFDEIIKKSNVPGIQLAIATGKDQIQALSFGYASSHNSVTNDTLFEIASLSKTFGTCFSIEFFKKMDIDLETPVNELLEKYGSDFRLTSSINETWVDKVVIKHLMSHTALNMHYVNGVPIDKPMPDIDQFLNGNDEYDYVAIDVISEPGRYFKYSGAGFIVLEYLVELISKQSLAELGDEFFKKLGLTKTSFKSFKHKNIYALGHDDKGNLIPARLKKFPLFAAGMFGTAGELQIFLQHLAVAYNDIDGSGGISHDTAVVMLNGKDKGAMEFMASQIGHGVFTVEAGENRFMLHQGANDGFRAIYLYCYKGPNQYQGFTILNNSELNGVILNAHLAQKLLLALKISGINTESFSAEFDSSKLSQEEIVNIGYKELVLDAFNPDLPEPIERPSILDPLAEFNLACQATITKVSNQKFARAENLFSKYSPVFDPKLFGKQGKVMDSWETARHNEEDYDYIYLSLDKAHVVKYLQLSTKYHLGNQVEYVTLVGVSSNGKQNVLIEKQALKGHAFIKIFLENTRPFKDFIIKAYPDGGLTRLGLYTNLPSEEVNEFLPLGKAECIEFSEKIPSTSKPMTINYQHLKNKNYHQKRKDYACLLNGASVVSATDEHYAPAESILSPFSPLNMFDGLESKRSRKVDHTEKVIIDLAEQIDIAEIVIDFTYFVNNNPKELKIEVNIDEQWQELVPKTNVKAYAGNKISFQIRKLNSSKTLKLTLFPDGGLNRILVYKRQE